MLPFRASALPIAAALTILTAACGAPPSEEPADEPAQVGATPAADSIDAEIFSCGDSLPEETFAVNVAPGQVYEEAIGRGNAIMIPRRTFSTPRNVVGRQVAGNRVEVRFDLDEPVRRPVLLTLSWEHCPPGEDPQDPRIALLDANGNIEEVLDVAWRRGNARSVTTILRHFSTYVLASAN